MKIKFLFFAASRELTGVTQHEAVLDDNVVFGTENIASYLKEIFPELDILRDNMSIAVNQVYVKENHDLKDGDTVAILPPISGG